MKRLCSVNKAFASAERGADTYYSEWLHVGSLHELLALVNVTAIDGSPILTVTLQTSPNGSTAFDHTVFCEDECGSIIATGKYSEAIYVFGKFVRLKAVVAGNDTPTVTFEAFIVAKS